MLHSRKQHKSQFNSCFRRSQHFIILSLQYLRIPDDVIDRVPEEDQQSKILRILGHLMAFPFPMVSNYSFFQEKLVAAVEVGEVVGEDPMMEVEGGEEGAEKGVEMVGEDEVMVDGVVAIILVEVEGGEGEAKEGDVKMCTDV